MFDPQAARERKAAYADVVGQCSHQHDGACADHFRDIAAAALEALEEAQGLLREASEVLQGNQAELERRIDAILGESE
jgi:hypothetical protein